MASLVSGSVDDLYSTAGACFSDEEEEEDEDDDALYEKLPEHQQQIEQLKYVSRASMIMHSCTDSAMMYNVTGHSIQLGHS